MDVKGYYVDIKGYHVDIKGLYVDVKGIVWMLRAMLWMLRAIVCMWSMQVASFLNVVGPSRNFSLMFVMGGALLLATPLYHFMKAHFKTNKPVLGDKYQVGLHAAFNFALPGS